MASTISIARALTQRLHHPRQPRLKHEQISLPIELITSTNAAAYDSPDISVLRQHGFRPDPVDTVVASAAGLKRSNTTASKTTSTPIVTRPYSFELPCTPIDETPNLTDASSIESPSPRSERNTLDAFFPEEAKQDDSTASSVVEEKPLLDAPILPKRAPSHSKREHVRLARQRSMRLSRAASPAPQDSPSNTPEVVPEEEDDENPFSPELEQIESVVSCYSGVAEKMQVEEDFAYLVKRGLGYYDGADYAAEIASLEESYLQG